MCIEHGWCLLLLENHLRQIILDLPRHWSCKKSKVVFGSYNRVHYQSWYNAKYPWVESQLSDQVAISAREGSVSQKRHKNSNCLIKESMSQYHKIDETLMQYLCAPPCNYFGFRLHLVHIMVSCATQLTLFIYAFSAFNADLGSGSQRAICEFTNTWFWMLPLLDLLLQLLSALTLSFLPLKFYWIQSVPGSAWFWMLDLLYVVLQLLSVLTLSFLPLK